MGIRIYRVQYDSFPMDYDEKVWMKLQQRFENEDGNLFINEEEWTEFCEENVEWVQEHREMLDEIFKAIENGCDVELGAS